MFCDISQRAGRGHTDLIVRRRSADLFYCETVGQHHVVPAVKQAVCGKFQARGVQAGAIAQTDDDLRLVDGHDVMDPPAEMIRDDP